MIFNEKVNLALYFKSRAIIDIELLGDGAGSVKFYYVSDAV